MWAYIIGEKMSGSDQQCKHDKPPKHEKERIGRPNPTLF